MDVQKFGYICVSSWNPSKGQHLEAIKEKGIDENNIFIDK